MSKEMIILDSDMDTDCDDAGALAVLHALADQEKVIIAGIICDVGNPWAAACAKAINISCGRPEILVGSCRRREEENPNYQAHRGRTASAGLLYNETVARQFGVILGENFTPEDGVILYRRILADAEENSVTICAIGLLTVLADLLESGPCEYSPFTGRELVAAKVKRLVTMAKAVFPEGQDGFNWEMDRASSAAVLNCWPSRLTVNALGDEVLTGRLSGALAEESPLVAAYRIWGRGDLKFRRPSWDQLTVLVAANAWPDKLGIEHGGELCYDAATGRHRWLPNPAGQGEYVTALTSMEELTEQVELLMEATVNRERNK